MPSFYVDHCFEPMSTTLGIPTKSFNITSLSVLYKYV